MRLKSALRCYIQNRVPLLIWREKNDNKYFNIKACQTYVHRFNLKQNTNMNLRMKP